MSVNDASVHASPVIILTFERDPPRSLRCIAVRFTVLARDLTPSSWLFALLKPSSPEAREERRDARIPPCETAEINTPEEGGERAHKTRIYELPDSEAAGVSRLSGASSRDFFGFRKIENF